jgi:hypothetical protein
LTSSAKGWDLSIIVPKTFLGKNSRDAVPIIQGEGRERGKRKRSHDRRFNALSRASQVHSRENPRDSTKPEQLPFQAGKNIR